MRIKASVTIYSVLMLISVLTIVFALLEASRISVSRKKTAIYTNLSCESLAGEYQTKVYADWNIFMLDGGINGNLDQADLNSRLLRYCKLSEDVEYAESLVQIACTDAEVFRYELATDNNGNVMYELIRDATKYQLTESALNVLEEKYGNNSNGSTIGDLKNKINQAREYIGQATNKATEEKAKLNDESKLDNSASSDADANVFQISQQTGDMDDEKRSKVNNLLSIFNNSYIALLVDDWESVSNLSIDTSERLLNRQIHTGNYGEASRQEIYDKLVLAYFCNHNFKSYINTNNNRSSQLAYEMEYILAGKNSDKANLENALTYILMEREAVNLGYLMTDETKTAEAAALAMAVAGVLGVPAAVEAVKYGILCSWAFCESVLEVRALTSGLKIYAIKNSSNWNLSLETVLETGVNTKGIKEAESGLSYADYLYQRFAVGNRKQLVFRAMDVMEMNLHTAGYENVRLDNMISKFEVEEKWQLKSMFLDLAPIDIGKSSVYDMSGKAEISYY